MNVVPVGFWWCVCVVLAVCVGCSSPSVPQSSSSTQGGASAGQSVEGRRIASLVPSLTEVAFDLGAGDEVVAVSDFDTHPPRVRSLTRLGGVLDPNLEALLLVKPDLVLLSPSFEKVQTLAKAQGVETFEHPIDTLDDLYGAYGALGRVLKREKQAGERVQALRAELEGLGGAKGAKRPKVLLVVGRAPGGLTGLYAAGVGSFLDDVLRAVGGQNALPKTPTVWPSVSHEFLATHAPDVIVELAPKVAAKDVDAKTKEARAQWSKLPVLEAAKKGRVFVLAGSHVTLPGPRVVQTARDLKAVLDAYRDESAKANRGEPK